MKPQDVAQYQKAGRGFLITRNSATIADTDYEPIAREIVKKLNAYPRLVKALRETCARLEEAEKSLELIDRRVSDGYKPAPWRQLLVELGEEKS